MRLLHILSVLLPALALPELRADVPARCQNITPSASQSSLSVEGIVTEPSRNRFVAPMSFAAPNPAEDGAYVDAGTGEGCQTLRGHGFAMTESTAVNLNKLPRDLRTKAMNALFSPKESNLQYVVLPLSSTDFNVAQRGDFSVCDCPAGVTPDPNGSCFTPDRLKEKIAILKEAQAINPSLRLMLKPWTTPIYMKKPGTGNPQNRYRGGQFDPKWAGSLGRCLVRAVEYVRSEGLKVQSVAVQNEPGLDLPYPSVYIDDRDHAKVLDVANDGLSKIDPSIQLVIRSDNFVSAPGVKATLEAMQTRPRRPVFAAHCYSNDPETPKMLLPPGVERFCPSKLPNRFEYAMGECTASGEPDFQGDFGWWMKYRVMNDVDFGVSAVLAWNGLLDEAYGPQNGGCTRCRGLISTDSSEKAQTIRKNPELFAITHLSRYTVPGSKRIVNEASKDAPTHLVFRNPDLSTVVLMQNEKNETITTDVYTSDCRRIPVTLPANSAATVRIR